MRIRSLRTQSMSLVSSETIEALAAASLGTYDRDEEGANPAIADCFLTARGFGAALVTSEIDVSPCGRSLIHVGRGG
jgi:hypothetical protein